MFLLNNLFQNNFFYIFLQSKGVEKYGSATSCSVELPSETVGVVQQQTINLLFINLVEPIIGQMQPDL